MLTASDRLLATHRINRHLPDSLQQQGQMLDIRLNTIERKVADWWMTSSDATRWLALGIDVLFTFEFSNYARKPISRVDLLLTFDRLVAAANAEEPGAWVESAVLLGQAWLSITPYTLWQMVEDAREAGRAALEDILLEAAQGDVDNTSVARAINKSFQDSVTKWQKAFDRP